MLSVIKGFTGKGVHMYFLRDKSELHAFVTSIREQLLESSLEFSPKPAKLKEIVASCMGYNSYAAVISYISEFFIDVEDFEDGFVQSFTRILENQPYGFKVESDEIYTIFDSAVTKTAYWDNEANRNSIIMASECC
jgi:hypothetical protein